MIFVTASLEAVPLLGFFSPGMVIVIIGGLLAKLGVLGLGEVVLFASLGATIGDLIGYYIGSRYGYSFLDKYGKYFLFRKRQYEITKHVMNNHTGKSLIIGRFNSFTRSFAPFIAGSTDTPFGRFLMFNVIGGIAWAVTFVMVGYIFGHSYELVSRYIGFFVTGAILLSIGIIYSYRFINNKRHIFSRYHLHILMLNIFTLYVFSKLVEEVARGEGGRIANFDIWLGSEVMSWWSSHLNSAMIVVTNVASPLCLSLLTTILLCVFYVKRKWYHLFLLIFGMAGGLLTEISIKILVQRERPLFSLVDETGYSFPSGHATMATIFFLVFLLAFKDDIKNKYLKYAFIVAVILTFISVGFSRIYLSAHWFSDVLAGFVLGIFWLTLLMLVFKFIITVVYKRLDKLRNT